MSEWRFFASYRLGVPLLKGVAAGVMDTSGSSAANVSPKSSTLKFTAADPLIGTEVSWAVQRALLLAT